MFQYVKRYMGYGILAILLMVGEVSADLYQPRMMAVIVNEGILGLGTGNVPNMELVLSMGLRMILVVVLGGISGILCGICSNITAQNFGNDVRKDCFRKVMNLSHSQTDQFTIGSLITRITSDITQVQRLVAQSVRGAVRCMMFFVVGSMALVSMDVAFSKVIMIALPLILMEVLWILYRTTPLFSKLQEKLDGLNTVIQEDIAGARVIKAYIQEDREINRFEEHNKDLAGTQFRVLLYISMMRPVMNIILNLATVAIIWIGGVEVAEGRIAPGTVMAAVTYLSQILNGMMMMALLFQTFSRGMASQKRLMEVLQTESEITDGTLDSMDESEEFREEFRGMANDQVAPLIEFRHVSFSYPQAKEEALHDVNLAIYPGETVAVIGATASGKSTLVQLIPRFYDVTEGEVLVGGRNVKEYSLEQLRTEIAMVLQKSELFSTTIRDNVSMGNRNASEEMIQHVCQVAQALDFIQKQPKGLDTEVAEGGMSLSGGQKQRIAIARALLLQAPILILDDSTSALDFATEKKLQDALQKEYQWTTKLIIAQRIGTVASADRIVVLEGGHVVGMGTHEELLNKCSVYQDIYESQKKKEA
ncbi:MAG: ABC transporter ATP-binding protein/permease [Lachnospiraceae bacterium]|nr:ABC transporter ATP-binding protein/permease [Lachnospiraceae bacterium]